MMRPPSGPGGLVPGGGSPQTTQAIAMLGERAETLCRRLIDVEQALAVQEWWMLGGAFPEARLLSEVSSLLAVARGELVMVLNRSFGRDLTPADTTEASASVTVPAAHLSDPGWVAASRDQAVSLLRMVSAALPAMLQYAQMLRTYAQQFGMQSAELDALNIVVDRLSETGEAFRQPPV